MCGLQAAATVGGGVKNQHRKARALAVPGGVGLNVQPLRTPRQEDCKFKAC